MQDDLISTAVKVPISQHKVYEDEARYQRRRDGRRVSLAEIVKAELTRGEQRLVNKQKQRQS
jgi:hypothetical protein